MGQGLGQVQPGLIESFLVDLELGMSGLHVNSFVFVGTTSDKGYELFLPGCLFLHVGVGEEMLGDFVGEHEFVELVNNG